MSTSDTSISTRGQTGLFRSTVVGAIVGFILTHALIGLFTTALMTSLTALVQGVFWSLILGAWAGFLIAIVSRFVGKT